MLSERPGIGGESTESLRVFYNSLWLRCSLSRFISSGSLARALLLFGESLYQSFKLLAHHGERGF